MSAEDEKDISVPKTGLILSGGGARAAYQVGVLKAIAEIIPPKSKNPFPIICGTSAGAINATSLACDSRRFQVGVRRLEHVWANFHASQVYRTDFFGFLKCAQHWLSVMLFGSASKDDPHSLLDNSPLRELLSKVIEFDDIQESIDAGALDALSVTVSGYTSSESICFFQGKEGLPGWRRSRRHGVPSKLTLQHLMASSAIPAIFPAVKINREYFGDGAIRQLAPISPALHLGANRVLVIGVSANKKPKEREKVYQYPSIAHIAAHILNSAFLDSLEGDVERLQRVNATLRSVPASARSHMSQHLRVVDLMEIVPSQPIDGIAARHAKELPRSLRTFLRSSGATKTEGSSITSYLLFERGFCRELIHLGYTDAIKKRDELINFLLSDRMPT